MTAVSVLGLGAMGSRMATRLVEAGHSVTVWNRTPTVSADLVASVPVSVAGSPRDAVTGADVVVSMVTDDAASRSLWLDPDTGALAAVGADAVVVEASTITPGMARDLAHAAAAAGVAFVEAPVVGSRPQADAGTLLALVGGDPDTFARARPVIDAYAATVHLVGPVGAAATLKLAVNGLFAVQVAGYAEIVGLLARSDVDPRLAIEILGGLPITSPALQRVLGLVGAREFSPNFPIRLVAKDLDYLRDLGSRLGAPIPVAEAVETVYREAAPSHGALDIVGVAARYLD